MVASRRHPQVVNIDEVESRTLEQGTKFGATLRTLGLMTSAQAIGCTLYEVPEGRAAFPFHYHCANEESLFVLEGEGTLRIGKETVGVRAGDYVTFPIGPDFAHQLRNTGTGILRYLCFSTRSTAEVVGYPDSKKVGAAGAPSVAASMRGEHWVRIIAFDSAGVGYYEGEDTG